MVHCRASHLDVGFLHTGILLEFRGFLDTSSAPRTHRCLIDAIESGDFVIVDLTEAESIDESGLYALEAGLRESRALGRDFIIVAAPGSPIRRTLESTDVAFPGRMYDSLSGVVASLRPRAYAVASA
jgi:anti-anti-sigma regulatory factor